MIKVFRAESGYEVLLENRENRYHEVTVKTPEGSEYSIPFMWFEKERAWQMAEAIAGGFGAEEVQSSAN